MLNQIARKAKKLFLSGQQEDFITPQDEEVTFLVFYKEIHVGTLELHQGIWRFAYSTFFRELLKGNGPEMSESQTIQPLFEFPEVDRVYTSPELWHFFRVRIPGLKQPEIKDIIEREHIDKSNAAALLKRFGKRTIANPFELRVPDIG